MKVGRVAYRWHPWHGRDVEIDHGKTYDREPNLFCRLVGDPAGRSAAVPTWMLDAAQCSEIVESDMPRVSWQSLRELRRLLSTSAAAPLAVVLQHRHFPRAQGDVDVPASTQAVVGTTGFVPGTTAENDLDGVASPGSTGRDAASRQNAQAAPPSIECGRRQEGGAS
jgi:hypothetical protein